MKARGSHKCLVWIGVANPFLLWRWLRRFRFPFFKPAWGASDPNSR